jgi:hypothetical protein
MRSGCGTSAFVLSRRPYLSRPQPYEVSSPSPTGANRPTRLGGMGISSTAAFRPPGFHEAVPFGTRQQVGFHRGHPKGNVGAAGKRPTRPMSTESPIRLARPQRQGRSALYGFRVVRIVGEALPPELCSGEEREKPPFKHLGLLTFLRASHSLWQCVHCQAAHRAARPKRSKACLRPRRNKSEAPFVLFGSRGGGQPKALNGGR